MRSVFVKSLVEFGEEDKDICILTGDLGFKLFDDFKDKFPDRFYDMGVAEANMIGVGSGLALAGKNVFCYSIIPFLVMRAYEQIRMDVAYHNANVKLIGVGGGFTYGLEGFSHFGLEDLSLMKTLPNMTIVVPADPVEAACLAKISSEHKGPMYVRLGKTGEPDIHESKPAFEIGKALTMREGKDVAIFAVGSMVYVALQAAKGLEKRGVSVTLINMHTIKPFDNGCVAQVASTHGAIFSVEEHYVGGGLGSSVAEVLAEVGYAGVFRRIGIPDGPLKAIGGIDYLREYCGLSPKKVEERVLSEIKRAS